MVNFVETNTVTNDKENDKNLEDNSLIDDEDMGGKIDDSTMETHEAAPDTVTTTLLPSDIPVLSSQARAISRSLSAEERRLHKGFWSFRSYRLALALVMGLVMLSNAWTRNTLSMAMVCMVNATAVALGKTKRNKSFIDDFDDCGSIDLGISADYGGDIIWTSNEQGFLFSAIYWAGAIVGLPGGWVIQRYGSKRMVTVCLLITLVCTLVTPVAAVNGGLYPTFLVRFFMGFGGQTLINTAIVVIIANWIPPAERSTTLALYTSGNQIAVIVAMPVNAVLCSYKEFLGGWPAIFYVAGVIVLIATIVWHVFMDDTPAQSRWISQGERNYIEKSLQSQNLGNKKDIMKNVPWRKMLLSNSLWSCVATNFAAGLVAGTLQSYIPTYYKEALHIDLKSNGLFSALPFLTQWISKMIFAVAADSMKKHTKISHTVICKGFNTLGTIIASFFLVACAFMDCKQATWAIVLLSLANAAFSGVCPGYITALICIAPAYTGVVNAIARVASQVSSILAPYMVGALTTEGTAEEWRNVFYIMGGMMTITGVYFLFTGTVKIQDWAKIARPKISQSNGGTQCQTAILNELSDGNNNKERINTINTAPVDNVPGADNPESRFAVTKTDMNDKSVHL